LLAASVLLEESCLFKKEPRKATIVIPPSPQPLPPEPMPAPPQVSTSGPAVKPSDGLPTLPPPVVTPPPPKRTRQLRRPQPPVAPETTPVQPPVTTPVPDQPVAPATPTAPALTPILGTEEIGVRNRRIQQYLDKARLKVLKAEREAGAPQRELISQVRTFMQQAEEARKTDVVRAENLAERAEVLSRGLR
jgi:hypothetical protein